MLVALAAFTGSAQAQVKERNIRVSNGINEDHPVGNGVAKMRACMTDKSGGKLKLQAFWGGALGGDLQATQALRAGTQEMVITSTSPLVGIVPVLGVFDLPFLFTNEKEADAVLDGAYGKYISDQLPAAGLVNLSYWENGFRNLTNSKRAVSKAEELTGLKVRVMQNNIFLDSFKSMGANATPMAFGEVFAALGDPRDRRPGEPARHHRHLEALRSAEISDADAPRLYALPRPLLQEALGSALRRGADHPERLRGDRPRRGTPHLARTQRQVARKPEEARACRSPRS